MDDYNVNVLSEAKNEYSSRLINILTPLIIEGIKSIFKEAFDLCVENNEDDKYLMTFQNFLSRVPKWNTDIINKETERIIEKSECKYLEDLLSCVHITQLKLLTSIRVSQQQKKIDIDIPKLSNFIHKCYIEFARKLYSNVYLFEKDILPLNYQKNMRECEVLCQECILNVIRNNMPIESILRAYIDETVDEEIIEEIIEKNVKNIDENNNEITVNGVKVTDTVKTEVINKNDNNIVKTDNVITDNVKTNNVETSDVKTNNVETTTNKSSVIDTNVKPSAINDTVIKPPIVNNDSDTPNLLKIEINTNNNEDVKIHTSNTNDDDNKLKFNNTDSILDMGTNLEKKVNAPKDIDTLEKISDIRHAQRKLEEEEYDDEDDDNELLKIFNDPIDLGVLDIHDVNKDIKINNAPLLTNVEVL